MVDWKEDPYSETSAFNNQTPGKYPKDYTQYSKHGESLKSTIYNLLTYLLTPCSRVILEKLTGFQLVKKLSEFYGTQRFITAVTSARHLSLS